MDEEEEEEDMGSFNSRDGDSEETKDDSFALFAGVESKASSGDLLTSESELKGEETSSPLKPSSACDPGDFVTQPVLNPKPDLREFPRQTNKDTLSILKAKRIIRHKQGDGPEVKKHKSDQLQ